jgi:putative ABC transport system substrate-binding protein
LQRRSFIRLLGGAAALPLFRPPAVSAQQAERLPVVGYLNAQALSGVGTARYLAAFQRGLRDTGFVDGQNVAVDYQWAEWQYDRLPALAARLIESRAAVIVATGGDVAMRAAKAATTTIPIVFTTASDPVLGGLVASLNRPGGNLTGVTNLGVELVPKRLELMHELVPAAMEVALLINPNNPNTAASMDENQAAARTLGVGLHVLRAGTESELDTVIANWAQLRAGPLVMSSDAYFIGRSEQIGALTLRHAVPTISDWRDMASAGALLSYGSDNEDMYRRVGVYTGRILRGETPAELPVQQSTKLQLVINLKTAKALGITVPLTLLGRADEAIE